MSAPRTARVTRTARLAALPLLTVGLLGTTVTPASAAPGDWTTSDNFTIERDARGERPEGSAQGVEGVKGLLAVTPYCDGQSRARVVLSDSHFMVSPDGTETPRQVVVDGAGGAWTMEDYQQPSGRGTLVAQMADGTSVPLWESGVPGTSTPIRTADDLRPWITSGVVGENTSSGYYMGTGQPEDIYGVVRTSDAPGMTWARAFEVHGEQLTVPAGAETLTFTYAVDGDIATKVLQVPDTSDVPCESGPVDPEPPVTLEPPVVEPPVVTPEEPEVVVPPEEPAAPAPEPAAPSEAPVPEEATPAVVTPVAAPAEEAIPALIVETGLAETGNSRTGIFAGLAGAVAALGAAVLGARRWALRQR